MINNVRRTLAVKASKDNTRLLSLNRSTFNRILGNIKQFLKEDYNTGAKSSSEPPVAAAHGGDVGNKEAVRKIKTASATEGLVAKG